jgi:hypothetical protein
METNYALPGLHPPKRHVVIRAQDGWRFLQPEIRGLISLSEIAQSLTDDGVLPDLDQATWLVVRAFERKELANGRARLIHDGREESFSQHDLRPAKKQRREDGPAYVRGGPEFLWGSAARLRQDLLDFLYVPLDAAEQWYARRGWLWNGSQAMPVATEVPSSTPEPATREGRTGRRSLKRGRPPVTREAARDLMLGMLRHGEITEEQLDNEKKAVLHTLFGLQGSANTIWAAKHEAIDAYRSERQAIADRQ